MIVACLFPCEVQAPVLQKHCQLNMSSQKRNKIDKDSHSETHLHVNQQEDKRMLQLNGGSNHFSLHVSIVIVRINVLGLLVDISIIALYKAWTKRQVILYSAISLHLYLSLDKLFIR